MVLSRRWLCSATQPLHAPCCSGCASFLPQTHSCLEIKWLFSHGAEKNREKWQYLLIVTASSLQGLCHPHLWLTGRKAGEPSSSRKTIAQLGEMLLHSSGEVKNGKWPKRGRVVLFKSKYKLTVRRQIPLYVLMPNSHCLDATASTWPPAATDTAPCTQQCQTCNGERSVAGRDGARRPG